MTDEGWDVEGPTGAPAIVFLHGAILSRTMWRPVVDGLRDRYRCIAVDLPGHGLLAANEFTLLRAAGVVSRAIDREAGGRAIVVGLSLGGYVAMAVAAGSPNRVRGLILAGATLEPKGLAAIGFLLFGALLRIVPERLVRAVDAAFMRRRYGRALTVAALAGGYFSRAGGRAVMALAGRSFRARLLAYGGPILVVNGDRDVLFRRGERRFLAGVPRVTTVRFAGATHLVSLDRPADFAAEVAAFDRAIDP